PEGMPRPAWAEVDLGAIRRNIARIRNKLTVGTRFMGVVKANAYGHGDVGVARAAIEAGATWLGVILVDEGVRLREAGIDVPILLLHEPPAERIDEAIANRLTPCLYTERGLAIIAEAADRAHRQVATHLKVDTGMNRLGVPVDQLDQFARALAKEPRIEVEAIYSHFAFADQPDAPFIDEQLARFVDACDKLSALGIAPTFRHMANSAAALTRPDAHFDLVRVGIAMYGLSPGPKLDGIVDLEPAMALKARAAMVKRVPAGEAVSYGLRYRLERPGTIVSVPLGYADGWPRALSTGASVLIGGRRYPAVGTVCMDAFMADMGDDTCEVGDEVVLIGTQGDERISADDIARALGTINYEIVTRISSRIPRVFRG
ncbi:MAG: alanine racemase, partial [Actinomycetota bacterium]